MDIYTKNSLACSRLTTKHYSTSFSKGIQILHQSFHNPVYAIYGYVRFADEIVDTFFEVTQRDQLDDFKRETFRAIEEKFSTNPIIHSFQWVVNKYNIDKEFIEAFITSMADDLDTTSHTRDSMNAYIYGSAEVVGLMCLRVFSGGNSEIFESVKDEAKSLGRAFQKVNFIRDMKSDFKERGRTYFPGLEFNSFNETGKCDILNDIEIDFQNGLRGIRKLPPKARAGVYLAYFFYKRLLCKIKNAKAERIKQQRVRVSNFEKLVILITAKTRLFLKMI